MTLAVGAEAPDFTPQGSERPAGRLTDFRGKKNVLLVFISRWPSPASARANSTRSGTTCPTTTTTTPPPWRSPSAPRRRTRSWAARRLHLPGAVRLLAARGGCRGLRRVRSTAGFASRGTFVIDRAGVVRFAECKEPGEARDRRCGPPRWTRSRPDRDFLTRLCGG